MSIDKLVTANMTKFLSQDVTLLQAVGVARADVASNGRDPLGWAW